MARHPRAVAPYWGVALAFALLCAPASATTFRDGVVTRVIDGDTFEIAGGVRIRVEDFDTPELRNYDCAEERALARAARDTARDLLMGERVTLVVSGEDRYRRLVATVTVQGGTNRFDFADRMVELGVGAHWNYGVEPQPDWCDGRIAQSSASQTAVATQTLTEIVSDTLRWLLR